MAPQKSITVGQGSARTLDLRPPSERRQRTTLVALRLLPEEHELLLEAARGKGMSLSELLRKSGMDTIAGRP